MLNRQKGYIRLFSTTFSNKALLLQSIFTYFNNISEQNCLGKPVFTVNKLNHFSWINNNVTNKIKLFPQLFALDIQIPLKLKCYYFLP